MFNHGYTYNTTPYYQEWLRHLVRKGNIVIFPVYQTQYTNQAYFTSNAIWSTKDAITYMNSVATVKPDTAAGMTLIGHSWGGPVSANMAARWSSQGLPQPKAVLFAEPYSGTIDSSLAGIPAATKIDCVVGNYDTIVGRTGCDALWPKLGHISGSNKNYVWMFSDYRGSPSLVSDHNAPAELNGTVVGRRPRLVRLLEAGRRRCATAECSAPTAPPPSAAAPRRRAWGRGPMASRSPRCRSRLRRPRLPAGVIRPRLLTSTVRGVTQVT